MLTSLRSVAWCKLPHIEITTTCRICTNIRQTIVINRERQIFIKKALKKRQYSGIYTFPNQWQSLTQGAQDAMHHLVTIRFNPLHHSVLRKTYGNRMG